MPESATPNRASDDSSDEPPHALTIDWIDRQSRHRLDGERGIRAARAILSGAGVQRGSLSLAVVDDAQMHQLNRIHLNHDYPTDVLSFLLESNDEGTWLEGEVIVSADTACREAEIHGWSTQDELLLYVVHGTLHLVGHDDHEDQDRAEMRRAEAAALAPFGLVPRWPENENQHDAASGDSMRQDDSR